MPYFGYARQDRKDEGRVPITAKLVANLITRAGVDRVLTMDLHAAQIQGFFDIPVDHLFAAPVIDDYFRSLSLGSDDFVVVSPDEGAIKRVLRHAAQLNGQLAIVDKRRIGGSSTKQANLIGAPIEGKVALIFDDMISTGSSICGAAEMVAKAGAREIYLAATHGILCGNARRTAGPVPGQRNRHYRHHPADPRTEAPQHSRPECCPSSGGGHQADSPQRVGQQPVQLSVARSCHS